MPVPQEHQQEVMDKAPINDSEGIKAVQHVDLDQILAIAHTGVRRASVFAGLGLNAMRLEEFSDYALASTSLPIIAGKELRPVFSAVPTGLPKEIVDNYKAEFGFWIINNGLRELVETFALFLDNLHSVALFFSIRNGKFKGDFDTLQKAFHHHPGLGWKLRILKERFDIVPKDSEFLESLYDARTCLSHRLGLVTQLRDCGEDGLLHVKWVGLKVTFIGEESGVEKPIVQGTPTDEAGHLVIHFVEKTLTFEPGEQIRVSREDLSEMCFFVSKVAQQSMTALTERLSSWGLNIRDKSQQTEAAM